jgi:thiamine pyrophosphate-dependent acetolactate synthase large subunit-like protein
VSYPATRCHAGLPGAVGLQLGDPSRRVLALLGDAGPL